MRHHMRRGIGHMALFVLLALAFAAGVAAQPSKPAADEDAALLAALPKKAPAKPARPRALLIYDANVGYGGHGSIPTANKAFEMMGKRTGAFRVEVSRDPSALSSENLRRFDAVFLNNTVGNLTDDPALRRSLVEFVVAGGGLMGVHGTSVAFTRWPGAIEDWPEFGLMIGARGASHLDAEERVHVRVEDPSHPVTSGLDPKGFDLADEFFRYGDPYSRQRVRVLLSIDNERSAALQGKPQVQKFRDDDDYALAWVRGYGRGRVFYSAIAHHPRDFQDPRLLRLYLAGAQYALGDLPASSIPSARLTPAIRAQEALGWRLGLEAYTLNRFSFMETIDRAAELGLAYVGGLSFQKVGGGIDKNLDPQLSDEEIEKVRMKLASAGVRILTYYIQGIPGDEAACRRVFEFAKRLGIETFMTEPALSALDVVERMADEYDIKVGLHNHDKAASPHYWSPDAILQVCKGRSKRIGACADIGYWMRSGIDPIAGVRKLGSRLITIQMHDLDELTTKGQDVPWGTGAGRTAELLAAMRRARITPVMFGLEYSATFENNLAEVARCAEFFGTTSLRLGGRR